MTRINMAKVLLGGLVAGLIINASEILFNLVLFVEERREAIEGLGLEPAGRGGVVVYASFSFLIGIVAVWMYAAIRPRYGAGPGTAVLAGLVVWFLVIAMSTINFMVMGLFPARLLAIGLIWKLVEMTVAALAGAWIYREE